MAQVLNILPLDVYERIKRGEALQVIDVREVSEVVAGKIPGAIHIPLGDFLTAFTKSIQNVRRSWSAEAAVEVPKLVHSSWEVGIQR